MMNDFYVDDIDTFTSDESKDSSEMQRVEISNPQSDETIRITIDTTTPKLRKFVNYFERKEFFYLKALKNKTIQANFLDLALNLEEGNISEEEYENEIDNNPDKYVIDFSYLEYKEDIHILLDIVKKMKGKFSVEDVSELFAIDADDLHNKLIAR